eukprot:5952991-Prymnesium_polylepis.1
MPFDDGNTIASTPLMIIALRGSAARRARGAVGTAGTRRGGHNGHAARWARRARGVVEHGPPVRRPRIDDWRAGVPAERGLRADLLLQDQLGRKHIRHEREAAERRDDRLGRKRERDGVAKVSHDEDEEAKLPSAVKEEVGVRAPPL